MSLRSSIVSSLRRYHIITSERDTTDSSLSYNCPSNEEIMVATTDNDITHNDNDTRGTFILPKIRNKLPIIILDSCQKKFTVLVDRQWTVSQLKQAGFLIHQVPLVSQRLIFMGRLLSDESTLLENGIFEPNTIIHLFPKPRVIYTQESSEQNITTQDTSTAHIPQILVDPTIHPHTSTDVYEAQYRLKFLLLLLFLYCFMELFSLVTIILHTESYEETPGDPTDTSPAIRQWQPSDYFDLALSILGISLSVLGMKAIAEQNRFILQWYIRLIMGGGIGWMIYYVESQLPSRELTNENYFQWIGTVCMSLVLPVFVWIICIVRACEYRQVLDELEPQGHTHDHELEVAEYDLEENQITREVS